MAEGAVLSEEPWQWWELLREAGLGRGLVPQAAGVPDLAMPPLREALALREAGAPCPAYLAWPF